MRRHDEALLWEYASHELDAEESALLEHHLDECYDCKEKLLEVRTAHQLLADAKDAKPRLDWEKIDAGIASVVEAKLAARARTSRLQWVGLAAAVAGTAIALAGYFFWPHPEAAVEAKAVVQVAPAELHPAGSHVEAAFRLTRVGARDEAANQGDPLAPGDVLRTDAGGHGFFHLADQSRVRLGAQSELTLMRASADEVSLGLERGRVAVRASHRPRKGFVVRAGGLEVRVIGTVFEVDHTGRAVVVAVAEGRVEVEPPRGEPFFVEAGQRVRFDASSWKSQQGRLTVGEKRELAELVAEDARAQLPEQAAVPTAVPSGVPSAVVASSGGPLPRLAKNDPRTVRHEVQLPDQAPPEATAAPAGETQVTVEPPEGAAAPAQAPQQTPGETVPGPRPTQTVSSAPVLIVPAAPPAEAQPPPAASDDPASGWNALPQAPAPAPAPASSSEPAAPADGPAAKPVPPAPVDNGELAIDHEAIFLRKAARSLDGGRCEGFLLGLQEIAGDKDRGDRAERARILRARCYDHRLDVRQAEQEYRRYLRDFPGGSFSTEARRFLEQ